MSIITKDQLKSGLTRANSYVDDIAATVGDAIDSLITRVETAEETLESVQTTLGEIDGTTAEIDTATATAAATLAESWAVGGTESRDGEDTDNAKYYAEQAAASATELSDATTTVSTYEDRLTVEESLSDYFVPMLLDGTQETYEKVMKAWFLANGAEDYATSGDYASLTALCDKWYEITREEWDGYTTFYQPDVSSVSTGTRGGDNENMSCTPSTDTVANEDDFAGLPMFAVKNVNVYIDDTTLDPIITAIEGITSNFVIDDPETIVGVMQQSFWFYNDEDDETYTWGVSAYQGDHDNAEPWPAAVKVDGTMRQWICSGKYSGNVVDSKITCCSGQSPCGFVSLTNNITYAHNVGENYGGFTAVDRSFLIIMAMIKYASLTLDGILLGCCNMHYQYPAQVSESGVNRVLVTTSQGANLEVGMNMLIGYYSESASSPLDRGTPYMYSISTNTGAKITAIETVTVDDTDYSAVYFENIDAFDTAANGTATEGTTYISTYHWDTGTTDAVLGNDGAMTSCTSGKYPIKLQGIEFMIGCYDIVSDALFYSYTDDDGTYWSEPYILDTTDGSRGGLQSTSLTDDYVSCGYAVEQVGAWLYIKKNVYSKGLFVPYETGGSSSTYTKDAFYTHSGITYLTQFCVWGPLYYGSGTAGLSCVNGYNSVSYGYWSYGARISITCNRGVWSVA